ncbi:1-acyl-sn-glycerol-3-phosphate acyltransferases [Raineyella antarctica]|uniref:1-acyl-sn-glycerol-3-phosphate acyltransferases n=1 Tax=Raineyella antarctica TaxID=1577474 RepID=A0A1G6HNI7_9ACTN|nr:lysophospholipid acyltransferase family protein [Raineyella antarctica]SDB95802.1 1-acyl-sn-glycerol-3-phosphate acyltransferases [Raineyella antarctica]
MDLGYRLLVGLIRICFRWLGLRLRITGLRNVPDHGGVVLAINHTAHVDFIFAGFGVVKANGRLVRFMAKKSIWQHPVAGRVMQMCRHIPVDRAHGGEGLRLAIEALEDGQVVGVYPEGTSSRSFEVKELKTGAVRMAQATGSPIVPTIVWGAQRMWTKDHPRNLTRSHIPVHVAYGTPIHVRPEDNVAEVTRRLREAMARLLDDVIAEYPPMTGEDLAFLPARWGGTAPTPEQAHGRDLSDSLRTKDEWTR